MTGSKDGFPVEEIGQKNKMIPLRTLVDGTARTLEKFLTLNRNFKIDDASKYIDLSFVDDAGCLSIFPPKDNMEGLFAARLIKF